MLLRNRLESKPNAADASAAGEKKPRESGAFLIATAKLTFRRRRPNCAPGTFGTPERRTAASMQSSEGRARHILRRRRERTSVRDRLAGKYNAAIPSAAGEKKPRESGAFLLLQRNSHFAVAGRIVLPAHSALRNAGPLHPCSRAKGEQGIFYGEGVSVRQYAIVSPENITPLSQVDLRSRRNRHSGAPDRHIHVFERSSRKKAPRERGFLIASANPFRRRERRESKAYFTAKA